MNVHIIAFDWVGRHDSDLPVWMSYIQHTLQNTPVSEPSVPAGVTYDGSDWAYTEFSQGQGIANLGGTDKSAPSKTSSPTSPVTPNGDEKKRILDLFKNYK